MSLTTSEVVKLANIRYLLRGVFDLYDKTQWYQNSVSRNIETWTYYPGNLDSPAPSPSVAHIYRLPTDSVASIQGFAAEGEHRCFWCEVSQFHFSMSPIWTIDWVNGSQTEDNRCKARLFCAH